MTKAKAVTKAKPVAASIESEPLAEGCVRVIKTQLEWSPTIELKRFTFAQAQKMAKACRLLGHDDWEVPSPHQQFETVDLSRYSPAADTGVFPDMQPGFYWSNETYKPSPKVCAWGVHFYSGGVHLHDQANSGFVRFVRRVSASQ